MTRLWLRPVTVFLVLHASICSLCVVSALAWSAAPPPPSSSWLSTRVQQLLLGCRLNATDGTVLFTPDASSSYGAQWTRDLSYAFEYAPTALFGDDAQPLLSAAIRYTFAGQRHDGCMPDRVNADGTPIYSPGGDANPFADHALDNGPFAAQLLVTHWRVWRDASVLCELEPAARAGLSFLRLSNGLVFNDPSAPNCTYGFTDTVAKQGQLLFTSLLLLKAARGMAAATVAAGCGNAAWYSTLAAAVQDGLAVACNPGGVLWNETWGLINACSDGDNRLPDVWGSALAVQLGGVLSNKTATAVVAALTSKAAGVFSGGQVRHLPQPLVWGRCFGGSCPEPGTYQNGAFWSTPLPWVVSALQSNGYGDVASQLVADTIALFQNTTSPVGGVMECVNPATGAHGVPDYVDSGTNTLAAASIVSGLL